jgi:hypothetical protein
MRVRLAPTLLFLVSTLVACSLVTPNQLEVTIDGDQQNFNEGVSATGIAGANTYTVRITGSSDPIRNAIDDESSMSLTIDFDRAAFESLPRNAPLRVSGVTTLQPRNEETGAVEVTFEPGTGHEPAITGISLTRSCFCAPPETAIQQSFEGTVELRNLPGNQLEVSAQLTLVGQIPYSSTTSGSRTTLNARAEVDAP